MPGLESSECEDYDEREAGVMRLRLYWSGKGKFFPGYEWLVVPLCFAVIYLISFFYFLLGNMVARKLRTS
jgi:hypothetical protein